MAIKANKNRSSPLVLMAMCIVQVMSIAPASHAIDLSAGLMVGEDFSGFWGKDKYGYPLQTYYRTGTCASAEFSAKFGKLLGARIEFAYVKKGKRIVAEYASTLVNEQGEIDTLNSQWDETIKFDYLEIPVLAQIRLLHHSKISIYFFTGPAFDFLIQAKEYILDNGNGIYINIRDETTSFDFCGVAGLSCERDLGPGAVTVNLRFSGGFLTTNKVADLQKSVDPDAHTADRKNWTIGALIGYEFKIK